MKGVKKESLLAVFKEELRIPIYQVHWNHHTWTFIDETEAWLFAAYWKLI